MRNFSEIEKRRIEALTANSISFTLIEPTETGLKKSIMDATGPVRNYLLKMGLHDYANQNQGPKYKVLFDAVLIESFSTLKSKASLYRPNTKKGDPRIWFRGLPNIADPNDIIALIAFEEIIYVLNLTKLPIEELLLFDILSPVKDLVKSASGNHGEIATELLDKLKRIAKRGPVPAELKADTAVGRTLETLLGIDINSSKKPDYKGIELKAYRSGKANRKNLFAQVPSWNLSKLKSSAEILDSFGYYRGADFKLYCTISTTSTNSQGLRFRLDENQNWLVGTSNNRKIGDYAVWPIEKLHERLSEKHKETFWIATDNIFENGKEYFQYKSVEHTKSPMISQFEILLSQGVITMDHLIKRNSKRQVVEKGPLFKIAPNSLDLLFPPSNTYSLLE